MTRRFLEDRGGRGVWVAPEKPRGWGPLPGLVRPSAQPETHGE